MTEVSIPVAFLAGMLSLLPACGPALVPAFFAYGFTGKPLESIKATIAFAIGFSLLFLPFGLGVRSIVSVLALQESTLLTFAGIILLLAGLIQILGFTIPGVYIARSGSKKLGFIGLGMLFGITSGACIAPTFGAIATLATTQDTWARALLLLIIFEAGMLFPLFLLAAGLNMVPLLKRLAEKRVTITIGGYVRSISVPSLVSSAMFFLLGLAFLFPKFSYFIFPQTLRNYLIDSLL